MTLRDSIRVPAVALAVVTAAAVLIGPPRIDAATETRATINRVTVPAAHFTPYTDDLDYTNAGRVLWMDSGEGIFLAAVPYDYPGVSHVFMTRVEMLALDTNGSGRVCLRLWRGEPVDGGQTQMGQVCTDLGGTSPTLEPESLIMPLDVRRVNAGQRAYLEVQFTGGDLAFYGARVTYTTNP